MSDEARVFTGRIKSGRLHVRGWKPLQLRDGEVIITVERAHAIRSTLANSLYWAGFVKPLADYTGNSPKWMHAYLKARFLPKHRIEIVDKRTGAVVDEVDLAQLTTTKLTQIEFSDYLHEIGEFAQGLGVVVGSNREAAA